MDCICETCARKNCPDRRNQGESQIVISCNFYVKQTNADRIRAMSDEELADLLKGADELDDRIHYCQSLPECEKFFEDGEDIPEHKCRDCLLKWLQQPAKEE